MEINAKVVSKSNVWGMDLLMILVSLGTQDRQFTRLLEAVEKQIKLGNIKEKVIVQAGETKYESDCMEIFDLIPSKEFLKLLEECSLLITHGGVGTIIDGLHHHKKIIAAARLCEYGEHQNNHQKQIIHEFTEKHYILELEDFDKLDEKLKEIKKFKPHEYQSNTNQFIEDLESYIDESLDQNKGNHFRTFMIHAFFGVWAILLQFICLFLFEHFDFNVLTCVCITMFPLLIYRLLVQKIFSMARSFKSEFLFLILLTVQILVVFLLPDFFQNYFYFKMFGIYIVSFILSFFLSLLFQIRLDE